MIFFVSKTHQLPQAKTSDRRAEGKGKAEDKAVKRHKIV
jgi:hypothetical protein